MLFLMVCTFAVSGCTPWSGCKVASALGDKGRVEAELSLALPQNHAVAEFVGGVSDLY